MRFEYRAIGRDRSIVTGSLDCDSQRSAARILRKQGLSPVSIEPRSATVTGRERQKARQADILLLMHQLATLLQSGLTLDEAITSLQESAPAGQLEAALEDISTQLRQGQSFSHALRNSRLSLPPYMYQLVEAGEVTGQLAQAVREGVSQMEYERGVANDIQNALIYPSILILTGIGAVGLIFTFVVPKFTQILTKTDVELPLLASAVLNTGKFMHDNILAILIVAVALALTGGRYLSTPAGRQRLWDFLMRAPLIGPWLYEADIGRWSAVLSTLLKSRVELTRALALAQDAIKGSALRSNLQHVSSKVKNGSSLAQALHDSGAITATGFGLVKVGERSGELAPMLNSLASLYTDSGRQRMKKFLSLLEPIAILGIGLVIGLVMIGIILAITSINDISI